MIGFEYLPRPYPYGREPFLVASGEKVGFEGRFFSIPAFAAQADKRLFTVSASHPVANVFKLYVNRSSNTTISLEPTISASGYERGTPHYADVILDIRDVLESAWAGHSADTDYSVGDFRVSHLTRQREPYNMESSSRPDVIPGDYTHKESVTLTPSGNELGAIGLQDIDIDEVQWQPFTRPKKLASYTTAALTGFPFEPFFPMVVKSNGSLPDLSSLDTTRYGQLGLGAAASGGVLITGDALLAGSTYKLLKGSGATLASEGSFLQMVPWALYPAQNKLSLYYETQNSGVITASGRQAIYTTATPPDTGVMLLNVSEAGTSGKLVQHWPGNYHATSGIDKNGKAHNGVHVSDRLIYNLTEGSPGNMQQGRSIINGKKIFGHFIGTETSSQGRNYGTAAGKYANGNTVFGFGGIPSPFVGTPANPTSIAEWFSTSKVLSPLSWTTFSTTVYEPRLGPASTTFTLGDINASTSRIVTRKSYTQFGNLDQIVVPDTDMAQGGIKVREPISFETHVYREGTDPVTGLFAWIELSPPESPIYSTQFVTYFNNTYTVGNIFTLFFLIRPNYGFVHVNGNIFVQWSDVSGGVQVKPLCNRFTPIGNLSTRLAPPVAYAASTITVGSFPTWSLRLYVTTNNQIQVPDVATVSPAVFSSPTFASDIPMTLAKVDRFGPAVWDPDAGVNYLYFSTIDVPARVYFAKMNTSFVITQINQVDATDAILAGRAAILSI